MLISNPIGSFSGIAPPGSPRGRDGSSTIDLHIKKEPQPFRIKTLDLLPLVALDAKTPGFHICILNEVDELPDDPSALLDEGSQGLGFDKALSISDLQPLVDHALEELAVFLHWGSIPCEEEDVGDLTAGGGKEKACHHLELRRVEEGEGHRVGDGTGGLCQQAAFGEDTPGHVEFDLVEAVNNQRGR